jgi:hypothetical protein
MIYFDKDIYHLQVATTPPTSKPKAIVCVCGWVPQNAKYQRGGITLW